MRCSLIRPGGSRRPPRIWSSIFNRRRCGEFLDKRLGDKPSLVKHLATILTLPTAQVGGPAAWLKVAPSPWSLGLAAATLTYTYSRGTHRRRHKAIAGLISSFAVGARRHLVGREGEGAHTCHGGAVCRWPHLQRRLGALCRADDVGRRQMLANPGAGPCRSQTSAGSPAGARRPVEGRYRQSCRVSGDQPPHEWRHSAERRTGWGESSARCSRRARVG